MKIKIAQNFVFLFFVFNMVFISSLVRADTVSAISDIEIQLEKDVFKIGEKLEGKLNVFSHRPAAIPVVLKIKIVHDDEQVFDSMLAVKIFPGSNYYSLELFNLPPLFVDANAVGSWEIFAGGQSSDGYQAFKEFSVKK